MSHITRCTNDRAAPAMNVAAHMVNCHAEELHTNYDGAQKHSLALGLADKPRFRQASPRQHQLNPPAGGWWKRLAEVTSTAHKLQVANHESSRKAVARRQKH